MMGAGKSSTGKAISALTGLKFIDLDAEIESQTHLTINEIFQKKGESFFRSEERRILNAVVNQTHSVVATGGGIVLNPQNVEKMQASGKIVYLAASLETLWERVQHKKDRPLLSVPNPQAVFSRLYQERSSLYESSCYGKIDTDGLSPEATAKKVVDQYLK